MKNFYILSFILIIAILTLESITFAATVGNPLDLDVPRRSAVLRQKVIEETLDEYEQNVKIKAAIDMEFITGKDLHTSLEVEEAEIQGQWYMAKLGMTMFNRIEPYIKIGTSHLKARWNRLGFESSDDIDATEVEADYGFAWGGGIKGIIWEFDDWGIRLTGDIQYRTTEPDVEEISRRGGTLDVDDSGADFKVDEWQVALILSKKFEIPLKWQSIYIVPYTGFSISDSKVDVKFRDPTQPTADYTLYDANDEELYGFLLGCDILPSLRSFFVYSIEVRLIDETALTLGGAMKF